MISNWPEYRNELNFNVESKEFEKIIDAIRGIRNIRSELKVPNSRKSKIYIETQSIEIFKDCRQFFIRLAFADEIEIARNIDSDLIDGCVQVVTDSARIFVPLDDLIDKEKEIVRLTKEKELCEKEIEMFEKKLFNANFVNKAPSAVVEKEKEKLNSARQKLLKTQKSIEALK